MPDQLSSELQGLYTIKKKEALKQRNSNEDETIFTWNGKPIEYDFIRDKLRRILLKAGLRQIRFHDIPHAYGSLLLRKAKSPIYLK